MEGQVTLISLNIGHHLNVTIVTSFHLLEEEEKTKEKGKSLTIMLFLAVKLNERV